MRTRWRKVAGFMRWFVVGEYRRTGAEELRARKRLANSKQFGGRIGARDLEATRSATARGMGLERVWGTRLSWKFYAARGMKRTREPRRHRLDQSKPTSAIP